jgi:type II secretory pathway pseudopilin PulG
MDIAEIVLIIFLSSALLVFLVLAIVATSILIGILRDVKKIADRAEEVSENLGEAARLVGSKLFPMVASATAAAITGWIKMHTKKSSKKGDK